MAYCPHCIFNISCASFVVNTFLFFLLSAVFCCVFLCISSIAFKQKTAHVCFYLHILRRVTESNVPLPVIIILLPNLLDDLDIYDEIYLGYPNYWNTMSMAVYTHLEQYDFTSKTISSVPMRAATFSIPLRDIQKTEVGTAVTKELAIQGSSVDSAKTVLAKWIWESRYEEVERAYSLVTAVHFLNAKNGADYKFSLHFLPGLWYTAYGISAMQFQPFACN